MDKGLAAINWTGGATDFRELVNDRAIFTQAEPPDGIWIRTESSSRTPTSAFADPLVGLAAVEDVTRVGSEVLGGVETDHYRGSLPIEFSRLEGFGLTDAEMSLIAEVARSSDRISVDVWVDPNHRIVRIARSFTMDGAIDAEARATTSLTNFGVMLDLESPPSASVTVLP